jgi:Tfp pilus assembly protein PilO
MFKPIKDHTKTKSFNANMIESLTDEMRRLQIEVKQLKAELDKTKEVPERCDSPAVYGISNN